MSNELINVRFDDDENWERVGKEISDAVASRPSRRPKNSGSLTEVRPGVWRLRVYRGLDPRGKPKYRSATSYGPRRVAERELQELQLQYGSNTAGFATDRTVGAVLKMWSRSMSSRWTTATVSNHRSIIDSRLRPLWPLVIDDTPPRELTSYYETLLHDARLSAGYVSRIHGCLRAALNWAVREGLCRTNPAKNAVVASRPRVEIVVPTVAEVNALIDFYEDREPWFAGLVRFAVTTGARRGELAALRWLDIDNTENGHAVVTFRQRVSRHEILVGLKAAAQKTMLIDGELIELLRHRSRCDTFVFGRGGRHTSVGTLSRKYRQGADALGLEMGTFHSLRHFCATALIGPAGMNAVEVGDWLGHSDASTTVRTYAHPIPDPEPRAALAIRSILANS